MKKHDKAGKHPFTVSIRGQLMLFIGGITLFTLLLVLCVCYVVAATNATALYANF